MSILTSASATSVDRGYYYYLNNQVSSVHELNNHEVEGYVKGSSQTPYYVKIDINHPKKSYCDCPHANGHTTCKHMVALYFKIYPNEANDYKCWLESDYSDDIYDEDNYYEDYHSQRYSFEKPLYFDIALDEFLDNLTDKELKELLRKELTNNIENTYHVYLHDNYKNILKKNNSSYLALENLSKKIKETTTCYDYNYINFNTEFFSLKELKEIKQLYCNKELKQQLNEILLTPQVAAYSDFMKLVDIIESQNTKERIIKYVKELQNYCNYLKHYSIKNNLPKSNILLVIYKLSNFNIEETAQSLWYNAKYETYVEHVINNHSNHQELYQNILSLIEKNPDYNKQYIPQLLFAFHNSNETMQKRVYFDYFIYDYLNSGDKNDLHILEKYSSKDTIIEVIQQKTKKVILLANLYSYFKMHSELWNLLTLKNNKHLLIDYIEALKDLYQNELYDHFINLFYTTLKIEKSRENYRKAAIYIKAISQLQDGDTLVTKILNDLKISNYNKCIALFDEIKKALTI